MNLFPVTKKRKGITYDLVHTSDFMPMVVYTATMPCQTGYKLPLEPQVVGYELHGLQWCPERTIGTTKINAGWAMRGDEQFGKTAWSYKSLGECLKKIEELRNNLGIAYG